MSWPVLCDQLCEPMSRSLRRDRHTRRTAHPKRREPHVRRAAMIQGHSAGAVALMLLPPLLATLGTAVRAGLAGYRHPALGPADGVTLARAVLTCGVAALVA